MRALESGVYKLMLVQALSQSSSLPTGSSPSSQPPAVPVQQLQPPRGSVAPAGGGGGFESAELANALFYEAFRLQDERRMAQVWMPAAAAAATGAEVQCVHAHGKQSRILRGRGDVMESWREIFARTGRTIEVHQEDQRVQQVGDMAFVTLTENLPHFAANGAPSKVLATNIFQRYAGSWYLVCHHATRIGA